MQQIPLPAAMPRMLHFIEGWSWIRRSHGRKDDEYRRRILRMYVTLNEDDEGLLVAGWPGQSLDLLWASAILACYGAQEAIQAQMLPAVSTVTPGDVATAAGVLGSLNRRHGRARSAQVILRREGWVFDRESGQVQAAPTPGVKANRPRLLVTKTVEAAYRDVLPQWREKTNDSAANSQHLRQYIAYRLELFFPPDMLTDDKVRNAIDNYLKPRRALLKPEP